MIVYFSGTGNSKWCAERLAKKLDDDIVDAFSYIRNGIAADMLSGRPWVFVSPTYGWRLPRVFSRFIETGSFSGSTDAYFVMTCGSEIGNSGKYNRELCEKKGLTYHGTLEVQMPENYIAMFDVPGEAEAKKIIAEAAPVLERGAACIHRGTDFEKYQAGFSDRVKSTAVNPVFYALIVKAKKFSATDACIGCGKCADACVLNNIQLKNGKPVWGTNCTHCMACICGCPVEAIEYGKVSQGKPRYRIEKYL